MPIARKYIEVLAFVAVWMAAGWIFRLDANAYLLLGVPLVALFQLFIRRQPLQKLWARDATSFRLGLVGIVIAALLMLAPGYDLVVIALPKRLWVVALWLLCALAGAVFAAFALRQQHASATRRGLPGFIAAVLIGVAIMAASTFARHHTLVFPPSRLFFLAQAVLALFCGGIRAGGGGVSRCSRFTRLSASKQWAGEWRPLAFCDLCLRFVGCLALAHSLHSERTGVCSGDSRPDYCSHLNRRAAFVLLASQRHFSLASSGPCSD